MLEPPKSLKSLNIDLYGGTSFPSWLGNSLFSNLVSLHITKCEYCMTLPPLGQLPSLKDLEIHGMKILEKIGLEFYHVQEGKGYDSSFQPFPSLECIKFGNMPNWKEWLQIEGINFAFPQLRTMKLLNCPELRGHYLPSHLPCIEEIVICDCPHLLETPSTLHWLSSIKKIDIMINGFAEKLSWFECDSPCMMQNVVIGACATLFYVPKLILRSTCLQHLTLQYLPSLTAFPSSSLPTSLQSLDIRYCKNLSFLPPEMWSNYTSLVRLELLGSCDALTSFPLDGFPALQTLRIFDCKSVDSIYILESPSRRPSSLKSLKIEFQNSIGLIKVKIKMDTLTSLEELTLQCEELSFCEGVCLPPKLKSIKIQSQRTTPPITEWGLQGLTALSRLTISADEYIINTLRKESLLPISLVHLSINNNNNNNNKMKAFDVSGLRHLSSLESLEFRLCKELESMPENCLLPSSLKSLEFWFCEKLQSLPEDNLPDSLEELAIYYCPLLEERYKRKEHWSKIEHIPFIDINGKVTI
ncbi:putative disease resistance RPP13 protein [Trifolium repens]|nr:putative disease resistance RPP13 protein [Trifolium repens]